MCINYVHICLQYSLLWMSVWNVHLLGVEELASLGILRQHRGRGEVAAILSSELLHLTSKLASTIGVDPAERTTKERRETKTKHGTNVTIGGVGKNTLLESEHSLVHETGNKAKSNNIVGEVGLLGSLVLLDDLEGTLVDGLLLAIIVEEALVALATLVTSSDHILEDASVATHTGREDTTKVLGNVLGNIETDLITKGDGANGETELTKGTIDGKGLNTLGEEGNALGKHGGENSGGVEAGAILDDDDSLALLKTDLDGNGCSLVRGLVSGDDLKEGHLVDRALAGLGNVTDGEGRGVGGKDAVLGDNGLDLLDNAVLESKIFEDGLDHEVNLAKVLVVKLGSKVGHLEVTLVGSHGLALNLGLKTLKDLLNATAETGIGGILEDGVVTLGDAHLGDTSTHETGTKNGEVLGVVLGATEAVLLKGGLGEEDAHESLGNAGHTKVAELVSLSSVASGRALLETSLDNVNDGKRGGVVTAGLLKNGLLGLVEDVVLNDFAAHKEVLDTGHGEGGRGALNLELASGKILGSLDGNLLEVAKSVLLRSTNTRAARLEDSVNKAKLLSLISLDVLAGEHHIKGSGNANQGREALSTTGTREETKHHLGDTQNSLGGLGGNTVSAGESNLETTTQAAAVDGSDSGGLESGKLAKHLLATSGEGLDLLLGLAGSQHFNVSTSNEAVLLARDEDSALDRGVSFEGLKNLVELSGHILGKGVDLLAGGIETNDGDAILHLKRDVLTTGGIPAAGTRKGLLDRKPTTEQE
eukprot:Colp12_sorted_trinity150504_noHs@9852